MTSATVRRTEAAAGARYSLRVAMEDMDALGSALGVALPRAIGGLARTGGFLAYCLGPDEWYLVAHDDAALARLAASDARHIPHSLVDISAREIGYELVGANASEALSAGCPADLEGMTSPSVRRTVFDGVQVVLAKFAEDHYRIDIWRSFAPHVCAVLDATNCMREL